MLVWVSARGRERSWVEMNWLRIPPVSIRKWAAMMRGWVRFSC